MLNTIAFWSSIFWFMLLAIMVVRHFQNNNDFNKPISIQESGNLHEDRGCITSLTLLDAALFFFSLTVYLLTL